LPRVVANRPVAALFDYVAPRLVQLHTAPPALYARVAVALADVATDCRLTPLLRFCAACRRGCCVVVACVVRCRLLFAVPCCHTLLLLLLLLLLVVTPVDSRLFIVVALLLYPVDCYVVVDVVVVVVVVDCLVVAIHCAFC